VPTELRAATLKMLLDKVEKAFRAPEQKLTPYMAEKVILTQLTHFFAF
jgi:hypothetical protein